MRFEVNVTERTDVGVRCTTASNGGPFWLSLKSCAWAVDPKPGTTVCVDVPTWLMLKHRQLAGDEAFEKAKQLKPERKTTMSEQREMSGTLSRNKKREHEKQPEYKGSATIDGVHYWLSAWIKQGPEGEKFFSLSFTRKDQPSAQAKPTATGAYKTKMVDDSIPF